MDHQSICKYCKQNISPMDYFCPSCGKKLMEKPLSTTSLKQLSLYLISFFLPPLGLWPAVKYLRQDDKKAKKIGIVAIVLTIISIALAVWLTTGFVNKITEQLSSQFSL